MRLAHPTKPRFAPLATVGRTEHRQTHPSGQRAECPRCDKVFVASAVITDAPSYSMEHHTWVRMRQFYCDCCNHIVTWLQATSADGTLEGPRILGPGLLKDRATVDRFLTQHPEAAGVEQS